MKILYDSQAFDMQTHGGVSRCFAKLYSHLPSDVQANIAVAETSNVYLLNMGFTPKGTSYSNYMGGSHSKVKRLLYKIHKNIEYGNWKHIDRMPNLNLHELERQIKQQDYDIFHPTFFDDYFLPHIGKKPFIITVHDMIPEIYRQFYKVDDIQVVQKKRVIPKASHIIAVSEQTKKDLIRLQGVDEEKITVIYHGSDESNYTPSLVRPYDFEYLLYVGERHFYKNFNLFVRDCVPILHRHKELKVICTGKPFTPEEEALLEEFQIEKRFMQVFVKSDQEFMDLYHYAVAFVYPSEYEGFGIPILEAYKADCPVMLNNSSCFPEIAGDAAVYFNMKETYSDFEEQFETLYHLDSNERLQLLHTQQERLKKYSWTESARQLVSVYQKVL